MLVVVELVLSVVLDGEEVGLSVVDDEVVLLELLDRRLDEVELSVVLSVVEIS